MAMLRFLAISSIVMIGSQLSSSQELVVLTRGYGCYLNDPLRLAIQRGDCSAIAGLGSHLPLALDAQYGLLQLTDVPQVKACIIALIKAEWESKMYVQPRALKSLVAMQIVAEMKRRDEESENFDRNAFLASLPEDVRDIIVKYMTPPSSL